MLPHPIQRGQPISADAINRIVDELGVRTHGPTVPGGLVQQRGGGTVTLRRPRGLHPAPRLRVAVLHPFLVSDASTGGSAYVRVRFGQVNSVTPTIGGTALDHASPPSLAVVSGVVYLVVTTDGDGLVTAAGIGNAASLPASDATYGYLTLAAVTVSGGAVTALSQSVTHSLGHQKCGTTVHNFWGL